MPVGGGNRIIKEMRRRLRVDRPVVEQGQPVLADQHIIFGEGCGDHALRVVAVKRHRHPQHGAQCCQACAFEKAAPVVVGDAAEEFEIRPFGIVGKERAGRRDVLFGYRFVSVHGSHSLDGPDLSLATDLTSANAAPAP